MIRSLHIENIAVVKSLDIDLEDGMTVLSGETGAGKSIIIDSLGLLLGAKADRELLRPLIERAKELGYTPPRAQVPGSEKIKARFRCWKDAVKAAGLPALNDPEQAAKAILDALKSKHLV